MKTGTIPCPSLYYSTAGAGYIRISDGGGVWEYEHRIVMEEWLCRNLEGKEVVHHMNGDKKDNRLENLKLCSGAKEHHAYHPHTWAKRKKSTIREIERLCAGVREAIKAEVIE